MDATARGTFFPGVTAPLTISPIILSNFESPVTSATPCFPDRAIIVHLKTILLAVTLAILFFFLLLCYLFKYIYVLFLLFL
jgi:hypothetical protein